MNEDDEVTLPGEMARLIAAYLRLGAPRNGYEHKWADMLDPPVDPVQAAVRALDAIPGNDPEGAHADADAIVIPLLPAEVRTAYERLQDRTRGWWYA